MSIDPKIFRQVRKALGLTQQELAASLGLSRVTVNKMEQGRLKRGIPDDIAERLLSLRVAREHMAKALQKETGVVMAVPDDEGLWENEEDES